MPGDRDGRPRPGTPRRPKATDAPGRARGSVLGCGQTSSRRRRSGADVRVTAGADLVGSPTAAPPRSTSRTGLLPAPIADRLRDSPGPGALRRRPCTACGHRCGISASGCPHLGSRRGTLRVPHPFRDGTRPRGPGTRRNRARTGSTSLGRKIGMADATLDLATVWHQIRERLARSVSPQQNAMLTLTRPLGLVEDTAVLAAPNEFPQTVLESRMRLVLSEALSERFGRDIRVAVQLKDAPPQPEAAAEEPLIRRPWSATEATRVEDDEDRARADDGRSAFGVRTDALPVWDRETPERWAEPGPPARSGEGPGRPVADRGAPEDWSPAAWAPGAPDPLPGSGRAARGPAPAADDDSGPTADVLPFDLDLPAAEGRRG